MPPIEAIVQQQRLAQARHAMYVGNTGLAQENADLVIRHATQTQDTALLAQACVALGSAESIDSRMNRAHALFSRARELFLADADMPGYADALRLQGYTSINLGLDVEARQLSLESVQLHLELRDAVGQCKALNYFGLVAMWQGHFDEAQDLLDASVWFGNDGAASSAAVFPPLMVMCLNEVHRITRAALNGETRSPARLHHLVSRARGACGRTQLNSLEDHREACMATYAFCNCVLACKLGNLQDARMFFRICVERLAQVAPHSWHQGFGYWARLELARMSGDLRQAVAMAQAMHLAGCRGEHVPMQQLGRKLESNLRAQLPAQA